MLKRRNSCRWRVISPVVTLLLLGLLLGQPVTALVTRLVLSVPEFSKQPYDQICWATRASMIIAYFKGDNIDRDVTIARLKYGDNFNQPGTLSDDEYYVRYYTGRSGSIQNNALLDSPPMYFSVIQDVFREEENLD